MKTLLLPLAVAILLPTISACTGPDTNTEKYVPTPMNPGEGEVSPESNTGAGGDVRRAPDLSSQVVPENPPSVPPISTPPVPEPVTPQQ